MQIVDPLWCDVVAFWDVHLGDASLARNPNGQRRYRGKASLQDRG
jgi:hypothetical protein